MGFSLGFVSKRRQKLDSKEGASRFESDCAMSPSFSSRLQRRSVNLAAVSWALRWLAARSWPREQPGISGDRKHFCLLTSGVTLLLGGAQEQKAETLKTALHSSYALCRQLPTASEQVTKFQGTSRRKQQYTSLL